MSHRLRTRQSSTIPQILRRAVSFHQAGNLREAAARYQKILRTEPLHFDALNLLGAVRYQQRRPQDALPLLTSALAVKPRSDVALNHYGLVLAVLGRHAEAIAAYDKAILFGSVMPAIYGNRARAREALGRHADALADYDQALAGHGDDVEAWVGRGRVLFFLGRHEEAIVSFARANKLNPHHLEAQVQSVGPLCQLKRFAEALPLCRRVVALMPREPSALYNLAVALDGLGELQQALAAYDETLRLDPKHADALMNRGDLLERLDRWPEGLASYEAAYALAPDHPRLHIHLCKARLAQGKLVEGWPLFEGRWRAAESPVSERRYPQPRWTGERLDGALLVWGEQGLGEQILYASMIAEARERCRSLVLEVEPRLVPLISRSLPEVEVVPLEPSLYPEAIAAQIPIGSLGALFRNRLQDFPTPPPSYLKADRARVEALRQRLSIGGQTVVGLSWMSKNPDHHVNKSARLAEFAALLQRRDFCFIDLQYGDTVAERTQVERDLGIGVKHFDDIDNTKDIDGLAALISACDVVVTVSNTTAHLAGALGKTTFVLVPQGRSQFWYWFKDRADSPWYPNVSIRRKRFNQSWRDLIAEVVDEITTS